MSLGHAVIEENGGFQVIHVFSVLASSKWASGSALTRHLREHEEGRHPAGVPSDNCTSSSRRHCLVGCSQLPPCRDRHELHHPVSLTFGGTTVSGVDHAYNGRRRSPLTYCIDLNTTNAGVTATKAPDSGQRSRHRHGHRNPAGFIPCAHYCATCAVIWDRNTHRARSNRRHPGCDLALHRPRQSGSDGHCAERTSNIGKPTTTSRCSRQSRCRAGSIADHHPGGRNETSPRWSDRSHISPAPAVKVSNGGRRLHRWRWHP